MQGIQYYIRYVILVELTASHVALSVYKSTALCRGSVLFSTAKSAFEMIEIHSEAISKEASRTIGVGREKEKETSSERVNYRGSGAVGR